MAEVIKCDVCGKECNRYSRYEFKYQGVLQTKRYDLCNECVSVIKMSIKIGIPNQEEE